MRVQFNAAFSAIQADLSDMADVCAVVRGEQAEPQASTLGRTFDTANPPQWYRDAMRHERNRQRYARNMERLWDNPHFRMRHMIQCEIERAFDTKAREVQVVNICVLLDQLFPAGHYRLGYAVWMGAVEFWCRENGAHLYEAPRETFNEWRGQYEAWLRGKKIVVVHDLS